MHANDPSRSTGFLALVAALLLLAMAGTALAAAWVARASELDRDDATQRVLAQAREALLAYAADRAIDLEVGPGYLPCPDRDGDGWAEATCGSLAGDTGQSQRLGWLPWKTLGLPDLRDGHGERPWYAVSTKHKGLLNCAASRACTDLTPASALGTLTLRDGRGAILHDGRIADARLAAVGGAAALVIAPGAPLARPDGRLQHRGCGSACSPADFLDAAPGLEDNATFVDRTDVRAGNGDGFIAGPVVDASGTRRVNDRIVAIGYAELMPRVMARVAVEAAQCVRLAVAQGGALPSPVRCAPGTGSAAAGRLPDIDVPGCNLAPGTHGWWRHWRAHVLYAPAIACASGGDCISALDEAGHALATRQSFALVVTRSADACSSPALRCAAAGCDGVVLSNGPDIARAFP